MNYLTFKCPSCGKKINVGATTTVFFCSHCGSKITLDEDDYSYYDVEEEEGDNWLDGLFWNIGGKIKTLTKVLFIVEVILSTLGAIGFMIVSRSWYSVILAPLGLIASCVIAWVTCFFMYGLGELIATNSRIARETSQIKAKQDKILRQLSANQKQEKQAIEKNSASNQGE